MPLPRRSTAWTVRSPWRRQEPGQAGRAGRRWTACRGGAGHGPAGADGAVRDADATGSLEAVLAWAVGIVLELGPIGRAPELAVRRSAAGLDPANVDGHLEPGEPFDGRRRSGRRHPGPASPRRRTMAATARARTTASRRATTAGVGDGRVVEQDRLDLRRGDVLAAAHDPVGAPVGDGQPAVVVETAEVAGPQPAVVRHGGRCRRGLVEIAVEQWRRSGPGSRRRPRRRA